MSKNPVPPSDEILDHIHEAYQLRGDTVYRIRGDYTGSTNRDGYKQFKMGVEFGRLTVSAHHIAWFLHYISWPEEQLDHKDRNKKNNSVDNLKYSTNAMNVINKNKRSELPPGVKRKQRGEREYFEVYIRQDGKKIYCGSFKTAWEAGERYKEIYVEQYGGEVGDLEF